MSKLMTCRNCDHSYLLYACAAKFSAFFYSNNDDLTAPQRRIYPVIKFIQTNLDIRVHPTSTRFVSNLLVVRKMNVRK